MKRVILAAFIAAILSTPVSLNIATAQTTISDKYATEFSAKRHHHKVRPRRIHRDYGDAQIVAHPVGCPRSAFCGCGASVKIFGHPVRSLFLAANWLKFPSAAPGPGMAAARRGHVMVILNYNGDGTATVYDANSGGHQTRIHTRSLAGYRIVNPHAQTASKES